MEKNAPFNPYDFSKLVNLGKQIEEKKECEETVELDFGKVFEEIRKREIEDAKKAEERNKIALEREWKMIPTYRHPNDPANYETSMFTRYNGGGYNPAPVYQGNYVAPQMVRTPYEDYLDELNRRRGQMYLDQRGYDVTYNFPNSRNLNWIKRYQRSINDEVNNPKYVTKQYWKDDRGESNFNAGSGIIPSNYIVSPEEDMYDNYYNIELAQNKELAESSIKKQKETSITPIDDLRVRMMTPYEKKIRDTSITTPSIDPKFLRNMPSRMPFTFDETASIQDQLTQVYGEYTARLLMGRATGMNARRKMGRPMRENSSDPKDKMIDDLVLQMHLPEMIEAESQKTQHFTTQDYLNYRRYSQNVQNIFANKQYVPGSGYFNTCGRQDPDGLPTTWFDDGGLYLTPTQEEIDDGEVVGIKLYRDGKLIYSNGVERKPEIKTPENEECIVRLIRTTVKEDGTKEIDVYDATNNHHLTEEEVHRFVNREANKKTPANKQYICGKDYKFASLGMSASPNGNPLFPDFSRYTSMIKSAQEQLEEDDTVKLTTELSRYNTFVADNYMWFSTILPPNAFKSLKQLCQSQLVQYREADPFAFIKSTVLLVGDKTVWAEPKPTSLEEIEKLRKECTYDLPDLDRYKTVEEKVKYLQSYRNALIIPKEKDDAYKYIVKKLIPSLNKVQSSNKANYQIYKDFSRKCDKDPITFEERFYKWWMLPKQKMSEKEYRIKYIRRMTELASQHMNELARQSVPYEEIVNQRNKNYNDFLVKLTNGKINNIKTMQDANEVTGAIIRYGQYLDSRRRARSHNVNVDQSNFLNALNARIADCRNFGGLDRAAAMIYGPEDGYKPIQINPVDPPDVRAQDYIKKIFRKKKGGHDLGY